MSDVDYSAAPVPVREDLRQAHARAFERLAAPGAWWTGAERVGIAAEVRQAPSCPLCRARKEALSPRSVEGEHSTLGSLPPTAVEAAHRLAVDAGRLSHAWLEDLERAGLDDGHYVELVGVVVTVVSIDAFCLGIGAPLHPLPEPTPGAPSGYRPPAARQDGAWVPMLPNRRPSGSEADLWNGPTGNVIRALSLVPDEVRTLLVLSGTHYLSPRVVMNPAAKTGRAIDRAQMELLAGRVSALNECFY